MIRFRSGRTCILGIAAILSCGLALAASAAPLALKAIEAPSIEARLAPAGAGVPLLVPTAPSQLTGQSVQSDVAVLLWRDNSTNESGFVVEGREAGDPTFGIVGQVNPNVTSVSIINLDAGVTYVFRVRAINTSGSSAYSNNATLTALSGDDCEESPTAMCLNSDEFRVQALFLTKGGQSGQAHAVELVADSGYLWFFGSSNVEVVVKVLDACPSRFWVFAGGLTDVRVLLTVTDTVAGVSNSYNNPLGEPFQPIQDTDAFDTCDASPYGPRPWRR